VPEAESSGERCLGAGVPQAYARGQCWHADPRELRRRPCPYRVRVLRSLSRPCQGEGAGARARRVVARAIRSYRRPSSSSLQLTERVHSHPHARGDRGAPGRARFHRRRPGARRPPMRYSELAWPSSTNESRGRVKRNPTPSARGNGPRALSGYRRQRPRSRRESPASAS
jgi:hypothetical protein